ncbi:haloacid dehalogenase type II [Alphaproteobacteria bacterium GH1-50]|uniref:(S)-2-haloacid dehalogenase n=1 Tax=Kangsaoukella pontilimi TaxID=2691042 RepID=A0A7C9ISZ9_9RHOB|nr:haloacid dehalogenase type II [Kangsaoukella pontilimi]MXQ09146.1 haloacid dehalogenase type II [Kangsaoukella pontilimi]
MTVTTCVFDAYGTLFDVSAAARVAAEQPGQQALAEVWPRLAADWRMKQLQYTWLRAITGDHTDFWQVTEDGLDWAMEASGLDDPVLRETLLALYWECPAYREAPKMLATLKAAGLQTAILSNGSPDMLEGAVDFAGIGAWLDDTLSVEDVGIFKPARAVYDLVEARLGAAPDKVLFVSANGWDAAGAAAYGFTTVWVNRAGDPVDRLPARPAHVVSDLTGIPDLVAGL